MEAKTNNPEPIMTVGAPVESFIITPEMIAAAEAKAAEEKVAREKAASHPATKTVAERHKSECRHLAARWQSNELGQAMVVDSLGETFVVPTNGRFTVSMTGASEMGVIARYGDVSKEYGVELSREEACGVLTGLINLVLENLPCNQYAKGAIEASKLELVEMFDNITSGMCQLAENLMPDNVAVCKAAVENNLYAYAGAASNRLSKTFKPYAEADTIENRTIENHRYENPIPVIHDEKNDALDKLNASSIEEMLVKMVKIPESDLYSVTVKRILDDAFGEDFIDSLTASEYYDLIDNLYAMAKNKYPGLVPATDPAEAESPQEDTVVEVIDDEYDDFYMRYSHPYSDHYYNGYDPYEDEIDDADEYEIWTPIAEWNIDNDSPIGFVGTDGRVHTMRCDLQGYPMNRNEEHSRNSYPVFASDMVLPVVDFAKELKLNLTDAIVEMQLSDELGDVVANISPAQLYAIIVSDSELMMYNNTNSTFREISFGVGTNYTRLRNRIVVILSELLGLNIETNNDFAACEILDIQDGIQLSVDKAAYGAYVAYRTAIFEALAS